jgi:hypothetical protein
MSETRRQFFGSPDKAPVESWITYEENKTRGILLKEEDISSSLLPLTIPSRSTLFHVSNSDCSDSIEYEASYLFSIFVINE